MPKTAGVTSLGISALCAPPRFEENVAPKGEESRDKSQSGRNMDATIATTSYHSYPVLSRVASNSVLVAALDC